MLKRLLHALVKTFINIVITLTVMFMLVVAGLVAFDVTINKATVINIQPKEVPHVVP